MCLCVYFVCVFDSNLVVRRGKPEEVVADLVRQLGSVSSVAFHEEVLYHITDNSKSAVWPLERGFHHHVLFLQVTSEELNVEKRVKDVCAQMKVKVHTCWGSTLYHRDDLPFPHMSRCESRYREEATLFVKDTLQVKKCLVIFPSVFRLPDVYTQFRKAVESEGRVRPVFSTPEKLNPLPPGLEEGAIPTAEDLQQTGEQSTKTHVRAFILCVYDSGCLLCLKKPNHESLFPFQRL